MKHEAWIAGVALACAATVASAQFSKPESAMKYRQAAFTLMGNHMGRIYGMVQGKVPYDKEAAIRSAEIVEFASKLPYEAFTAGSDLMESKAKPAIWKEEARFRQLASDMQAEVVKLGAAARTGNLEALRTQFRATAKACDACHDVYKEK
jgi:cytochrome c556